MDEFYQIISKCSIDDIAAHIEQLYFQGFSYANIFSYFHTERDPVSYAYDQSGPEQQEKIKKGLVKVFSGRDFTKLDDEKMIALLYDIVLTEAVELYNEVYEYAEANVADKYSPLSVLVNFYVKDRTLKNPTHLIEAKVNEPALGYLGLLTKIDPENFYRHVQGVIESVRSQPDYESALKSVNMGLYSGAETFGMEPIEDFASQGIQRLSEILDESQFLIFMQAFLLPLMDGWGYGAEVTDRQFRFYVDEDSIRCYSDYHPLDSLPDHAAKTLRKIARS